MSAVTPFAYLSTGPAIEAFFGVLAANYPNARENALPAAAFGAFHRAATTAIEAWLETNVIPATAAPSGYTCARCCAKFPPGVTGHTEDNPCD